MSIRFTKLERLFEETGAIRRPISLSDYTAKIKESSEIEFANSKIVHGGRQALIYIKDNRYNEEFLKGKKLNPCDSIGEYEDSPLHLNRVHFYRCDRISEMIEEGKFAKYVATNRQDGLFLINVEFKGERKNDIERKLLPCGYCLDVYKEKFPERRINRNDFDYEGLFEDRIIDLAEIPRDNEFDIPPNEYSKNWAQISWKKRKSQNWTCEKCKVNLENTTILLHTHHKNGNRWDNSWKQNLQVLCYSCHANQPGHERMKNNSNYHQFKRVIERLRAEQGLNDNH